MILTQTVICHDSSTSSFFVYNCWIYQVIRLSLKVFWKDWVSFPFKFLIIISCRKSSVVIVRDLVTFDILGIPKFSLVNSQETCQHLWVLFYVPRKNIYIHVLLMPIYQSVGGAVQNCTKTKSNQKAM